MAGQKERIDALLAESFKELACRQPIEKITIKAVTDRAGVIRPTFYNHFQDKYELLEWIINHDLIEPIKPFVRSGLTTQAMTFLFLNVEKEKDFYTKVSRLEGQDSFDSISQRLAQYYGQSMVFILIEWIQSGMTIGAQDLAELYQYVMSHSLEDALEDL